MEENSIPESALVIVAHPDDAEFTVGGTVALWTKAGCEVTYVICTDGNSGSHEPGMTREKLAEIRRAEQRAACKLLGVNEVIFLGYDDGLLMPTLDLRRDLVHAIRKVKPQAILTWNPGEYFHGDEYINHPDHRAAAQAAIDATAPVSEMPLLWPEAGPPHKVKKVYVHGNDKPNLWVDITDSIDQKITALRQHASQMGDWDPTEMIKKWDSETGEEKGLNYAESYRVINLERHSTEE
jgi:LmbE family N-acetylglucosaminyl deacetylase